jgi:hypothetical protein
MKVKHKRRKKSQRRDIVLEDLDPFEEYANESPSNLTHEIRSDIDDGNRDLDRTINAIHAIDQYKLKNPRPDKKPLITLLKSRGTSAAENKLLADLIERLVLKWPVGARRRPAYVITNDDHALLNARADVSGLRAGGLSVADAITQVAADYGTPEQKLADAYQGRRRSMRKKK